MSVLNEEWRTIPGFEGRYEVSDLGNVRAIWQRTEALRGQFLRATPTGPKRRQYPHVWLYRNGTRIQVSVHSLVMVAFEGPPPARHEIDHLDNDPLNARYSNLEYVTRPEQARRAIHRDHRRLADRAGEKNASARLTWDQVREIRRRLSAKEISGRALAREMGMSQGAINDINTGRNWKEVLHVSTE